jgi:hypothetical protein
VGEGGAQARRGAGGGVGVSARLVAGQGADDVERLCALTLLIHARGDWCQLSHLHFPGSQEEEGDAVTKSASEPGHKQSNALRDTYGPDKFFRINRDVKLSAPSLPSAVAKA